MPLIRIVDREGPDFEEALRALERRGESDLGSVEPAVREVLGAVRRDGDSAVKGFIRRFENRSVERLLIEDYGGHDALESLESSVRDAMTDAAQRIRRYHE